VQDGTLVGVDGARGAIWVEPAPEVQEELKQRREKWLSERQRLQKVSHALAMTRDGRRVEIVANVGNILDAKAGLQNGAEGIGLLRTEFLYLTRETAPEEDEQAHSLRQIAEALAEDGNQNRPIVVRTMDIGGDKALPYLPMPPEANPFLGVRALRLSLRNPEIFSSQLKAILRAGLGFNFKVMFPMVANLDEVRQARQWLEKAHQELADKNIPHIWPIETGIMVEIPSAALISNVLAPNVDFFSIGTNDLTQYTLAAERGNPALSGFADGLHPAVLRLIQMVTDSAHKHGKWVGVCGELAGDPLAGPILVGLGVDELSMNPGSIPRMKEILRKIDLAEAQSLARSALEMVDAAQVRQMARKFAEDKLLELL
jgi:phosphoenolpyruvate-protein phosphotransferase